MALRKKFESENVFLTSTMEWSGMEEWGLSRKNKKYSSVINKPFFSRLTISGRNKRPR